MRRDPLQERGISSKSQKVKQNKGFNIISQVVVVV